MLVSGNAFGDIVSDAYAGLVGGLGFAASGNLGNEVAVFEPSHGSAPKYAELEPSIVNPLATILSAAMLLEHVGEGSMARRVRSAVASVVLRGEARTFDMLGLPGGPEVLHDLTGRVLELVGAADDALLDADHRDLLRSERRELVGQAARELGRAVGVHRQRDAGARLEAELHGVQRLGRGDEEER